MYRNRTSRLAAAFASMVITFALVSGISGLAEPPVGSVVIVGDNMATVAG